MEHVAAGRHYVAKARAPLASKNPFYTEYEQCIAPCTRWGASVIRGLCKGTHRFAPVWLYGAFSSFPIYGF